MKKWLLFISSIFASAAYADAPMVPNVFLYQSAMTDDGGNPIADGQTGIMFRIVDEAGSSIYVERQQAEVVGGRISALVGNGVDPANNAPTGGIPVDELLPAQRYFLEVAVDGQPASGQLELASVPYALYSAVALSVADAGVSGTSIADGSITAEHFSDEGLQGLAQLLLQRNLLSPLVRSEDLDRLYGAPSGASHIGMSAGLRYSGHSDVEGAIRDLDRAVAARAASISAHEAKDVAAAHPGSFPVARLSEDIATQAELDGHRSAGIAAAHPGSFPVARLSEDIATQAELDGHRSADIAAAHSSGSFPIGRLDTDIATQQELNAVAAQVQGIAVSSSAAPSIHAWGRIANTTTVVAGHNVLGVSTTAAGQRVSFSSPLASANYAVTITPLNAVGQSPQVSNVAVDGFEIQGVSSEYSFLVVQ